ncbi:MAG TPA: metabolite traffic protein EboE [Planctomycetaceae bacterium]|jgi:sugar phosphate isomerase/epimerase
MALSDLPLSYCTNVHPGRSLAEVDRGLDEYTAPLRTNYGAPLAAGLWLAAPVIAELVAGPAELPRFRDGLARRNLTCHTVNAFPYGDFHSRRVKENVYLPDWSDRRRLDYTIDCARVLAALLPDGVEGSISTVPLAFKGFTHAGDHLDRCAAQLVETAVALDRLQQETGRLVRLAIEPEPYCLVETTDEAIDFFEKVWRQAGSDAALAATRRHLGLCYDVCHQAVEFEDIPTSIGKLVARGVRINKVHITCALELESPGSNEAGCQALAAYVEERYLHQTLARSKSGAILRQIDLTADLALRPPAEFREAEAWRIHFHVPVNAEHLGPLRTTRQELRQALETVAGLDYAPHLEVETYTWEVLPGRPSSSTPQLLIDGLTGEMLATRQLLAAMKAAKK